MNKSRKLAKEELEQRSKKIKNQLLFFTIIFLFFGCSQTVLTKLLKNIGTVAILINYGVVLVLLILLAIWYHKFTKITEELDEWKEKNHE